jgi:hypothetical protein
MDCEINSPQARLAAESLGFTSQGYAFDIWDTCREILSELEPGEQPPIHYWDCYDWLVVHGGIEPLEDHCRQFRVISPMIGL